MAFSQGASSETRSYQRKIYLCYISNWQPLPSPLRYWRITLIRLSGSRGIRQGHSTVNCIVALFWRTFKKTREQGAGVIKVQPSPALPQPDLSQRGKALETYLDFFYCNLDFSSTEPTQFSFSISNQVFLSSCDQLYLTKCLQTAITN